MTENEAIKVLEKPSKHIRMVHKTKNEMEFYTFSSDLVESFETAIHALSEIQQYRAIGSIEEFKALKEKTIAEKPLIVPIDDTCLHQEYRCPSCNEWLADILKPYRCKCGKLLDWQ